MTERVFERPSITLVTSGSWATNMCPPDCHMPQPPRCGPEECPPSNCSPVCGVTMPTRGVSRVELAEEKPAIALVTSRRITNNGCDPDGMRSCKPSPLSRCSPEPCGPFTPVWRPGGPWPCKPLPLIR